MPLTDAEVEALLKRQLAISAATLDVVRRLAERADLEVDAELAGLLGRGDDDAPQ